ncbi:hypothetical protein Tco_1050520 [Tanacetum coccineum]
MRNKINLHTVRDDTLLGRLKFVSKTQDYQQYGSLIPDKMINQDIKDSKAYKTYLDFATRKATPKKARKFKKVASPSKKLSPVLEEEPTEKTKRAKKPAKKSTTVPTAGVVIKDTLGVFVSKKKAPTKVDRGKGMYLLSEAALLKAAQLKKTLKKSQLETHKLHASGSGDRGDSDDDDNDDDSDDVTKDDDVDADSDADGDNEASDSEKTDSNEDENPNLNQNKDEEEEYKEEYVCTPDRYGFTDDDKEYEELYKDVNMRLKDAKHEEKGKGDVEMTDAARDDGTQHTTYEQVKDDEHVILTTVHGTQKTEVPLQSSSISFDFANQFLNLDNVSPIDSEVISTMNVKVRHEEPSTQTPSLLNILVTTTPTPTPLLTIHVTVIPETSIATAPTIPLTIPSITSLSQQSTPTPTPTTEPTTTSIPSQIPAMVDAQLSTRLEDSIQKSFRSYTAEFERKANDERKRYIDLVEQFVKDIIKDENVILSKSSSQPKSTYEAATSLTEFELKKILLDKIQKSKSYRAAQEHKDLYDALVKSYKLDKDLFESYGKAHSLKRDPVKTRTKMKTLQLDQTKVAQAEESVFESTDTEMPQNQGGDLGNTNDQANVEAASRDDYKIAKAEKPPLTFDKLISTPIDFLSYVINNLKIENLTQEHLVGPAFNLLKRTCRSRVELEYHFEECYKAVTDRLDWTNPEGQEYPFDLSKPLPLIEDRDRQVVLVNYFINNDLEYLKGGSSSMKYMTSITKTKAAKYDDIQGIKDMVPSLWSPVKSKHDVFSTKRIIATTHVKVMKWYDYRYLEEIEVQREDHQLYKFREGNFPRLNLRDIEDMLLLLVQKKLSNLKRDVIFDVNVSLRMFTRRVVILKRVEDLQLRVKSYQKKLNITKPETFRPNISNMTPYTTYNNPQGIIYLDRLKRNRLMRSDELYKFCDDTLTSVRSVLHDIASSLRMDYLPKRN